MFLILDSYNSTVTPSAIDHIEGINHSESSVTEEAISAPIRQIDMVHSTAGKDKQIKHSRSDYETPNGNESSLAAPKQARKDAETPQNQTKYAGRTLSPRSQDLRPSKDNNQASATDSGNNSISDGHFPHMKGRSPSYERLRPTDSTTVVADRSAESQKNSSNTASNVNDLKNISTDTKRLSSTLTKPQSYERLRPTESSATDSRQPAGIRKIYGIKPEKDSKTASSAARKSVTFSEPLTPSPIYTPTSSDISSADTTPTISNHNSVGPHNRSATRPPLHRRTGYSTPAGSQQTSSLPGIPSRSSAPSHRGSRSARENDTWSYDSSSSDSDPSSVNYVWQCPYKHCDRHRGSQFPSLKDMRAHVRVTHKRDRTGSE